LFIYEEEARMKIGRRLFAILAFGALSTNVAVARHYHGHQIKGGTAASQSGTGSPQGFGPAVQGGVADHPNGGAAKDGSGIIGTGKGIVDDVGSDTKKSVNTDPSTDTGPAAVHGLHNAATPGPGASGKDGAAGVAIDTRITVHQGRQTIRDIKESVLKKTKTGVPPPIGRQLEHGRNNHRVAPVGSNGGLQRNAVGDALDRRATAPTTSAVALPTNAAVQGAAAVSADPVAKSIVGNTPISNANALALHNIEHGPGVGAIGIVSANGLSISGTGIGHPRLGTGAIGGPAKIVGVLNGTTFRTRHP
jgi:hypothetical protein